VETVTKTREFSQETVLASGTGPTKGSTVQHDAAGLFDGPIVRANEAVRTITTAKVKDGLLFKRTKSESQTVLEKKDTKERTVLKSEDTSEKKEWSSGAQVAIAEMAGCAVGIGRKWKGRVEEARGRGGMTLKEVGKAATEDAVSLLKAGGEGLVKGHVSTVLDASLQGSGKHIAAGGAAAAVSGAFQVCKVLANKDASTTDKAVEVCTAAARIAGGCASKAIVHVRLPLCRLARSATLASVSLPVRRVRRVAVLSYVDNLQ
jgi:hypothetical protein